jgi:predicted PurR-regulated permease PerM
MKTISVPVPDFASVKNSSLRLAGLVLVLYLCYVVRQIWLPLGLAFILAIVLDPVVDRMEKRGWSRAWASAFIFGSFLFISIGLLFLTYPFALAQADTMQRGFEKYFPDPSHAGLFASFRHMGLSPSLSTVGVSTVESARANFQHSSTWITDYGMAAVSNAIWIVIVPIVAYYALRDFHVILAKGLMLVPSKHRDLVQTAVSELTAIFGKYLRGLAIVSILNGVATAILLSVLHVPGALILGVVAGILYSVPYIGAFLTVLITAAVAFVGGGPDMLVLAVGFSTLLHQIVFDQIVSPRIIGGHVGLHPILSIIALLVGNLLLGVIGMILAVPITACIQIAVLAVVPKLSREIDIQKRSQSDSDTVGSLARETKRDHQKPDTTGDMLSNVIAAVEAIEREEDPDYRQESSV